MNNPRLKPMHRVLSKLGLAFVGLSLITLAGCSLTKKQPTMPQDTGILNGVSDAKSDLSKEEQAFNLAAANARMLEKDGKLLQAIVHYEQLVKQDPSRHELYQRLGICHDRNGDHKTALRYYQKALEVRPGNPDVFADIGYSFYLQKNWGLA